MERAPYEELFQDYSKLMQEHMDLKQQMKMGQGLYSDTNQNNWYSVMDSSLFGADQQLDFFVGTRTSTQSTAGLMMSKSVMFP